MEAARTCRHCQGDWRRQEEHDHDPDAPSKSQRRLRPCSGCRTVWYCCALHRRRDWIEHVFACKPDELTTAHYLVRAVQTGMMPDHLQTIQDYGFSRCPLPMQKEYLFGMYSDFIKVVHMGHPYPLEMNLLNPEKLHDWRVQGLLVAKIKAAFDALPPSFRGAYYSWFLQNQHILNTYTPSLPPQDRVGETRQSLEMSLRRAWIFAGGSPSYSDAEIHHFLTEKDVCEANCILLYAQLFCGARPARQNPLWIHFGFCACANAAQESTLAQLYVMLAERHAFSVIYVAWSTSKLDHMFRQECAISPAFAAFFSTLPQDVATLLARLPSANHSVWDLKRFISNYGDDMPELELSAMVDYGFTNCRNHNETEALRQTYRRYFDSERCKPLLLHEACIQGQLFEHVNGVVRLKNKKLQALMKNSYPVPGYLQSGMSLNFGVYDIAGNRIHEAVANADATSLRFSMPQTLPSTVPQQARGDETRQTFENARRRAWIFAGGAPHYSDADIHRSILELVQKDKYKGTCIVLYIQLFWRMRPTRTEPLWIYFGFCACRNETQEATLAHLYVMLAEQHDFSAIYDAWSTSKLHHMFRQECARSSAFASLFSTLPHDVSALLATLPSSNHSVWNLKMFILNDEDNIHIVPTSMLQDYGFINCRTPGDVEVLRHAYRRYFDSDRCQPLRLHEACIQGRLFQHINGVVRLKNKKLHALMRNCYPAYGRYQAGMSLNLGFYDLAESRIDQTGTDGKPSSIGVKLALVMIGVVLAAMLVQNWLTS